jgi:hypothetical protein
MRLAVPRQAAPVAAKLGWNLNTPTGPSEGGVIRITGA